MSRRPAERLILIAIIVVAFSAACSTSSVDPVDPITVFGNRARPRCGCTPRGPLALRGRDGHRREVHRHGLVPPIDRASVSRTAIPPTSGSSPNRVSSTTSPPRATSFPCGQTWPRWGAGSSSPRSPMPSAPRDTASGVLFQVNVKSLVWYSPAEFAARGYEVPSTWTELETLAQRITADGLTPWCMGVSAFDATGWPATDWVEDLVLRMEGPDVYDAWVAGELAFTDPRIGAAIAEFGDVVLSDEQANGGRRGVLNTSPARAQDPMFASPPGCLMYKQASFQKPNLPDGVTIGEDVDVFVLPPMEQGTAPILIGGTVAAAFTDREETWALMRYLATASAGEPLAEDGGYISPHADFDAITYGDDFDRRMASIVADADVVRFDGSDLMYSPVGTRSFFDAMVQFIATERLDTAQQTAQAGYDR